MRYHNMIEDYYTPTNVTIKRFGLSHLNLKENVNEIIIWLESEGRKYF